MPGYRFGTRGRQPRNGEEVPPFIRAFIDTRRWRVPLPPTSDDATEHWDQAGQALGESMSGGRVRAGQLYDVYADAAEAAGEPALSHVDFGVSMQALGFDPYRDGDGRYYVGLNLDSRPERARQRAYREALRDEWTRLFREQEDAHAPDCPNRLDLRLQEIGGAVCMCDGMLSRHARAVMYLLDAALIARPRDRARVEDFIEDRLGDYVRS